MTMFTFRHILGKVGSRKSGITMMEISISMVVMTIALAMVSSITMMIFSQVGRIQANLTLDEEATKFQTSMRYVISQHWSAFASITEVDNTITLNAYVPYALPDELLSAVTSTISCVQQYDATEDATSGELILNYISASGESISKVLAEHISSYTIEASGAWLYYDVAFELKGIRKTVEGAVKYY